MTLINEINRLRNEMFAVQLSFINNRNNFDDRTYTVDCNGYKLSLSGNFGSYELRVFESHIQEPCLIMTRSSYPTNEHSILYNNGYVRLIGKNPIRHKDKWKVFFNSRMTKEKYFHYSLEHDMPSYEHTQTVILMKKHLQKPNMNFNIHLNKIDIEKLKLCNLDVVNFQAKYKDGLFPF